MLHFCKKGPTLRGLELAQLALPRSRGTDKTSADTAVRPPWWRSHMSAPVHRFNPNHLEIVSLANAGQSALDFKRALVASCHLRDKACSLCEVTRGPV
jgi:hypothetical protein